MRVWDRKNKRFVEYGKYGAGILKFLYSTRLWVLQPILLGKLFSEFVSVKDILPISYFRIAPFVNKYKINTKEYEGQKFYTFASFFERKIDMKYRPLPNCGKAFLAPADSKLMVIPIQKDMKLVIKDVEYTLNSLTGGYYDCDEYSGGQCLIFRLSMDDYHHYHHVDDGKVISRARLHGKLHTVGEFSDGYPIFMENKREITRMLTKNFGELLYIEVGALLVGRIVNPKQYRFKAGEEKGFFRLGGSTVIVLVKPGQLTVDEDILKMNRSGFECKVAVREKIGVAKQ